MHSDLLTDWLRDAGFNITDQTRSGRSSKNAGEIDLMVRNATGTPVTIIEAFRANSCGDKNTNISSHINKLIHDYDTIGHEFNFIVVYAEAKDFVSFWKNYNIYLNKLNSKQEFINTYPLLSFDDTSISDKANLKIGLAKHKREDKIVKIYHIVVNMYKA